MSCHKTAVRGALWLTFIGHVTSLVLTGGSTAIYPNATSGVFASSCNAAKQRWISEEGKTAIATSTFQTILSSEEITYLGVSAWTSTFLNDSTPYTLCDGYPRLDGSTSDYSTALSSTITHISTVQTSTVVYRNLSAPTCVIPEAECNSMQAEYNTSISAYRSAWNAINANSSPKESIPPSPTSPVCGSPTIPPPPISRVGDPLCFVGGITMQLLYWPAPTPAELSTLCPNNRTGMATQAIAGGLTTIETLNTTFTSPTAYMIFDGTWRYTTHSSLTSITSKFIMPMSSESLSTRCAVGYETYGEGSAINYRDWDYPIPASAYRCQTKCWTPILTPGTVKNIGLIDPPTENLCSTILDDFRPILSVPPEFSSLKPAQVIGTNATCSVIFDPQHVFYDPPIALQPATSIPGVSVPHGVMTTPGAIMTEPASPVHAPALTTPHQTTGPELSVPSALPAEPASNTNIEDSTNDVQTAGAVHIGGIIASVLGMGQSSDESQISPIQPQDARQQQDSSPPQSPSQQQGSSDGGSRPETAPSLPASDNEGTAKSVTKSNEDDDTLFIIGGQTFIMAGPAKVSIAPGIVLKAGDASTVSGSIISLASNADYLVVDGTTAMRQSAQATSAGSAEAIPSIDSPASLSGTPSVNSASGVPQSATSSTSDASSTIVTSEAGRTMMAGIEQIMTLLMICILASVTF